MNPLPSLRIDQYFVDELRVKVNPKFRESKETPESKLTASLSIKRKGSLPEFMIVIELEVNGAAEDFHVNPYYVFLKITGYFSFIEGTGEPVIERMIALNGPAILYGIARGIVAQATGNCVHDKFILPTVNFVEVTKEKARTKKNARIKKNDHS